MKLARTPRGRMARVAPAALALLLVAGVARAELLEGRLNVAWGDAHRDGARPVLAFSVTLGDGVVVPLAVDDALVAATEIGGLPSPGGLAGLAGEPLRVWVGDDARRGGARPVMAIARSGDRAADRAVSGAQPWVSLLCKFADVSAEPRDLSYFQGMFDNAPGRLDHYWREVSYGAVDVVGSAAAGWFDLPGDQLDYVSTPGTGCQGGARADLGALFADCTAAADPFVDFANGGTEFVGINLMFNDDLDGCAWGGGHYATLDGIAKSWRTTWEPPWGYAHVAIMAHEMGHGFGLPHSTNYDDDGNPYDSEWDVMSNAWGSVGSDPTYGNLGKHTLAYHKDVLGWIDPSEELVVDADGEHTITIDNLALAATDDYRMATVTVDGSPTFYTVEVRGPEGLYDGALPATAVIIAEIEPSRSEPAWVYDEDVPPGGTASGPGSLWEPGETFVDPAGEITIAVGAATTNGFTVTITRGDAAAVFTDGFESGDVSAWSASTP